MINRRGLLGWLSVSPVVGPSIAKAAIDSMSLPIVDNPPKNIKPPITPLRPKYTVTLSREQQEVAKLSYPRRCGESNRDWVRRVYATYARNLIDLQMSGL